MVIDEMLNLFRVDKSDSKDSEGILDSIVNLECFIEVSWLYDQVESLLSEVVFYGVLPFGIRDFYQFC